MDDTQDMQESTISIQEVIESLAPQEQTGDADAQHAGGAPAESDGGQDAQQEAPQDAQEPEKDAPEAQKEAAGVNDEQVEAVRTLLADGWTREELLAFSEDETAQKDMREGRSMRQAALAYLRRQSAAESGESRRKRGAPIARNTSSGASPEMDPVKSMSDAQFDRFMADVRRRAMRGEKVRL